MVSGSDLQWGLTEKMNAGKGREICGTCLVSGTDDDDGAGTYTKRVPCDGGAEWEGGVQAGEGERARTLLQRRMTMN